jgi:hypothetical protein
MGYAQIFPCLLRAEVNKRKQNQQNFIKNVSSVHLNFPSKLTVEESIVNAPLVSLQSKNTNNAKSELRFKQLIRDS